MEPTSLREPMNYCLGMAGESTAAPGASPPSDLSPWNARFVWLERPALPSEERKPGLVLFFNLECAGCVARAIPYLKRIMRDHGDKLEAIAVHTSYGHRDYPEESVVPQIQRFARDYARLAVPVALDLDGALARAWGVEGTPHWLVFDSDGQLIRSIFGSQENAVTRLDYLLEELLGE